MIIELTQDILDKKLKMSEADISSRILNKDWAFDIDFDCGKISLFHERNKNKYTCRFAPKGIEVCYLAQDPVEREKEVRDSKQTKKVYFINKNLRIIDLNFQGPTNRANDIKKSVKGIEKLVNGERIEENYKDSCLFAKLVIKAGFDGIYYSAHPDEKHTSEFQGQVIEIIKKTSPHFEFNNAMGPKERLVIFKNNKEIISFEQYNYITEKND